MARGAQGALCGKDRPTPGCPRAGGITGNRSYSCVPVGCAVCAGAFEAINIPGLYGYLVFSPGDIKQIMPAEGIYSS